MVVLRTAESKFRKSDFGNLLNKSLAAFAVRVLPIANLGVP
jgi:hypothetical protein